MTIITNGVKYIGSKKTLNDYIVRLVQEHCDDISSAIDVFTGTTRVAQALRQQNIQVVTSDLSWASEAYAHAFVHNKDNRFLQPVIDELNSLKGYDGWLTTNYCDVLSKDGNENVVRVWQAKNGRRADAIRDTIEELEVEHWVKMTLITSLIFALDAVDNTVGVQQAYLKNWCARSHNDMQLQLPALAWNPDSQPQLPTGTHIVGDALTIDYPQADLAYLDPPYSPHSYASYYHIWDSITKWDKPEVGLKTNRRIDRVARTDEYDSSFESPWNRKKQALGAFENLIERLPVRYCLISYSSDSLIPSDQLFEMCESKGSVTIERIDYKRNIMHKIGNLSEGTDVVDKNQEFLILIEKT